MRAKMPPLPVSTPRLPWIDHLRTFAILLVVNVHACVTYGHVGDWYVMSAQEPPLRTKLPFILWEAHLQSFFMGLLFFLSGYFAPGSLARRGPSAFVRERIVRLGLPTLFFMLIIHPCILLGLNPWKAKFGPPLAFYMNYLSSGRFLRSTGPLWFAFALLIFSLALAAWSRIRSSQPLSQTRQSPVDGPSTSSPRGVPGRSSWTASLFRTAELPAVTNSTTTRSPEAATQANAAPSALALGLFAVAVGTLSFFVRLIQPIGTNFWNMQLCYFPQYIAFFVAGVHAARAGWLLPLAVSERARRLGWLAFVASPILFLGFALPGARGVARLETVFFGGWHWQAFCLALWEQLAGVGLSLGLLALFSAKMSRETPLLRWLADRSFAVYVLHTPVLVGLFMLYRSLPQNPFALAALLTVTGLLVSYALADLARRVPGLRRIF